MALDIQSGKLGALLIMIAVIVSTAGGFLFNAHDVTSCASDFTYVTDVAGAFDGSKGDMNVDYNPQTNYTGYTVFDPTDTDENNPNIIHGINYERTGANGYWIQENDGNVAHMVLSLNHNTPTTGSTNGTATLTWTKDDDTTVTNTVTINGSNYGKNNSDLKSIITVDGHTNYRIVAISLSDLMGSYGQSFDTNNIFLSVQSPTNEYPCFIGGGEITGYGVGSGSAGYLAIEQLYEKSAYQIRINPSTLNATIDGSDYGWDRVMFVWGTSGSTNATIDVIVGSPYETYYINPAFGVQPSGAQVQTQIITTETSYATEVRGTITTPNRDALDLRDDSGSKGQLNITLSTGGDHPTTHTFSSVFTYATYLWSLESTYAREIYTNGVWGWHDVVSNRDSITFDWRWDMDDPNHIDVWYNVSNPTDSNISATLTTSVFSDYGGVGSFEGISSVTITMEDYNTSGSGTLTGEPALCSACTNEVVNVTDDETHTETGSDSTLSTVTQTTDIEPITSNYVTYWVNGYQNVVMDMVISKGSLTNNTDTFYLWFYNGSTYTKLDLAVTYADNQWKLSYGDYIGNYDWRYGDWDAIVLTVSVADGQYTISVTPVSKFDNFTSYTLVGKSYDLLTGGTDIQYLNHIQFPDTTGTYFYHAIVHTTVLLKEGGLYIQDGTFCLHDSFPNDLMVQLKIMAAARSGESMTVTTSEGNTFTLRSNGIDGWVFNDETYRYGDVAIWYIDSEMESVVIESVTYTGAIYYNGQTYDRGHLYIQLGANADLIDLGESDNTWTVTMNGVWAMSTAYYQGENVADSHIEIDKAGKWSWDKQQFLMVFLGIITLGTILCAWKIGMKPLDWIVVVGAGFVIFMMLG